MANEEKDLNEQVKEGELEQINKMKVTLENLRSKNSTILFFITSTPSPAASVYEIYNHATILKNLGYFVKMLTDDVNYQVPDWIEKELTDIPHEHMASAKFTVTPADMLVIPEIFSNVMEQTKNLPCIRVGFLQGIDYMLNALTPGMDWSELGIKKVITTSNNLKNLMEEYFGKGKFDIKTYDIGIPDYFKKTDMPKRPVISIVGRNPNEISKIVKLFYARYPHYRWVTFDTMLTESKPPKPMRRKDFADKLARNFAAVWVDRIASFGTFPVECMKVGTIPIALKPDITPEYLVDQEGNYVQDTGVWTDDIYALPLLIGDTLIKFLDDSIPEEMYQKMDKIAENYNATKSKEQIEKIYTDLFNERAATFEEAIKNVEQKSTVVEEK
ncbi:MAG: hypothetical protein ACOCVF_01800 [bacterium]